ncbi:hypothetical protein JHK84_052281 [Glycine max]|nr:hypothetical protein JHK86_052240 [Glycine max]KAG5082243.1 hypothetical protein JHK84_052281 [Glycine max]
MNSSTFSFEPFSTNHGPHTTTKAAYYVSNSTTVSKKRRRSSTGGISVIKGFRTTTFVATRSRNPAVVAIPTQSIFSDKDHRLRQPPSHVRCVSFRLKLSPTNGVYVGLVDEADLRVVSERLSGTACCHPSSVVCHPVPHYQFR